MNLFNINTKPVEYILYQKINEDAEYIPRFQLKNNNGIQGIEIKSSNDKLISTHSGL